MSHLVKLRLLIVLLVSLCIPFSFASPHQELSSNDFNVILVDKANFKLHFATYSAEQIKIQKTYHVTLGKADGDKQVESDLKTPEGVYFFTSLLRPPTIKKKFGQMALMMNYPNPIDQRDGKTGYDIMLHATDDPTRLKRDRDSEGCVVIDNPEIEEISKQVKLGVTPIIIYPEIKPEYLSAPLKTPIQGAFQKWLKAWKEKDLDAYIGSYSSGFSYGGMNLKQYRDYKASLNKKYASIDVDAENVRFFSHPKYDVVSFTQNYSSTLKKGVKGFKSSGTKTVYFVKDGDSYKIAVEAYSGRK